MTTLPHPDIFADFTLEGGANTTYWNGSNTFTSAAAWLTAIGGTFSRSSTAYYTNSSGTLTSAANNVFRFDYDPILLTLNGLLLEGASTNLLTWSQENFNTANWTASGLTAVDDTATAPDGNSTASKFSEDNSNGVHRINNVVTLGGGANSFSAFAKKAEDRFVVLTLEANDGTDCSVIADLIAGKITATNGAHLSSSGITAYPNGWFRIWGVSDSGFTQTGNKLNLGLSNSGTPTFGGFGAISYTGTTGNGALFWGAQVENLGFVSSYIPTGSGTANRSADLLTIPSTLATATFFAKTNGLLSSSARIIGASASGSNAPIIENSTTSVGCFQNTIGSITVSFGGNFSGVVRSASSGTPSGRSVTANGASVSSDTNAIFDAANSNLYLLSDNGGNNHGFGWMQQFGVWSIALTPTQLQTLTASAVSFAYGPLVDTTLTRVPAKAFTRKHYQDLLEEIREEVAEERESIGHLDERGRADREFDIAQRMLNQLESNLTPFNYAKAMDAREKLEAARKTRDHHYFMEVVNKEWAKYNGRQ